MNPQHHQCNIHIIGLGVAEQAVLGVNALQALNKASLLIGSERQLETIKLYVITIFYAEEFTR